MHVPGLLHLELENALYQAFPAQPRPLLDQITTESQLEQGAKRLFAGRSWPDVVGHRLNYGELSPGLSVWMATLPPNVFDYYVASHLLLASLLLDDPAQITYLREVMQAFLLPPADESVAAVEEMNNVLPANAMVARHGVNRMDFYSRITPAQRACIGQFLDLYQQYQPEGAYSERGLQLFEQNKRYWLDSSR